MAGCHYGRLHMAVRGRAGLEIDFTVVSERLWRFAHDHHGDDADTHAQMEGAETSPANFREKEI